MSEKPAVARRLGRNRARVELAGVGLPVASFRPFRLRPNAAWPHGPAAEDLGSGRSRRRARYDAARAVNRPRELLMAPAIITAGALIGLLMALWCG